MEKRKFRRFLVDLKVEAGKEGSSSNLGLMKDFSREGLGAIFDEFEFSLDSPIRLNIQSPNSEAFIPAIVQPLWKRWVDGKWNVGFRLKEFPPVKKADILEYGYHRWVKENNPSVT